MDRKVVITGTWEFMIPDGWVSSDGGPVDQDFTAHVAQGMATNPIALLATRMTDPDNQGNWQPKELTAVLMEKHLADGSCCNEKTTTPIGDVMKEFGVTREQLDAMPDDNEKEKTA